MAVKSKEIESSETLDFDYKHYPQFGDSKPKERWLCACCLNELNNFFDKCDNETCNEKKEY